MSTGKTSDDDRASGPDTVRRYPNRSAPEEANRPHPPAQRQRLPIARGSLESPRYHADMTHDTDAATEPGSAEAPRDFVRQIIDADLAAGRLGQVRTRFPPEPNGYLHIGHAKSINLNFGIAREYGGTCNLRFDDTNPTKEDQEYVDAIIDDIRWLGFEPDAVLFTSDYFGRLYDWAEEFVRRGWAYVDEQSTDEVRAQRGTAAEPGQNSPHRGRTPDENLELFRKMRDGGFGDGQATLRAKIDMASKHLMLRDPLMYRVRHAHHHRTGDQWCLYPMYDWAHGQADAIEGISHSLCSLEFETHKPLYNWFLDRIAEFEPGFTNDNVAPDGAHVRPHQHEFGRLKLAHALMSKRKLLALVEDGVVDGWDDPRFPTLRGFRARGYTASAINAMCEQAGVSRMTQFVAAAIPENALRAELNKTAQRRMAVLDPLKVTVTNWDQIVADGSLDGVGESADGPVVMLDAVNNPEDDTAGSRQIPFGGTFFIERADFMEDPPKKFFRLGPGREVRLRWAFFFTCDDFVKNDAGEVIQLRGTIDPATRGGDAPDGRKVKGTLHWVGPGHVPLAVTTYEPLLTIEDSADMPDEDWRSVINADSRTVNEAAIGEPSLDAVDDGETVQFERHAYYKRTGERSFSRVVTLKDSYRPKKK